MTSQRTSITLCGYASSGSRASNASDFLNTKQGTISSIGGYSADKEETVSQPPSQKKLRNNQKRNAIDDDESAKRRRMNEMHFTASTVHQDLARAGMTYPEVRTTKPRAPTLANVDLSGVHLINSKDITSPVLVPVAVDWDSKLTYDLLTDFGSAYNDILRSCAAYYVPPFPNPYAGGGAC